MPPKGILFWIQILSYLRVTGNNHSTKNLSVLKDCHDHHWLIIQHNSAIWNVITSKALNASSMFNTFSTQEDFSQPRHSTPKQAKQKKGRWWVLFFFKFNDLYFQSVPFLALLWYFYLEKREQWISAEGKYCHRQSVTSHHSF